MPRARADLKVKHRLLNPREESLSTEKQQELQKILSSSSLLQEAHTWKEAFGE
ncbi:transposase [Paenibacillus larvae]|nr:transposase [Paenibacillus larvae]MEC0086662.1 transposase [Paenibacillus larvae]MEC0188172.1 transposase [Paenibacillus larvae]